MNEDYTFPKLKETMLGTYFQIEMRAHAAAAWLTHREHGLLGGHACVALAHQPRHHVMEALCTHRFTILDKVSQDREPHDMHMCMFFVS